MDRCFFRLSPLLLAGGAAAALLGAPARAQVGTPAPTGGIRLVKNYVPGSMGIPQPEPKVTLSRQNRTLFRILGELFKQTPYEYRVIASVGTTTFSVEAKDEPLSQVLRKVLEQDPGPEPLVFSFTPNPIKEGGTFVVDREYLEVGQVAVGENRVSVTNGRLPRVLELVFKRMGAKYRIEPDVPPVLLTLQLRPDSWPEALPHVIIAGQKQETGLTYSMDQDTYVVHLQKTPTGVNSRGQVLNLPDLRLVSVNAPGVPLKDALAQVFQGSSWKYQVSSRVPDARVTYSATRQPELAALQGLLRQASTPRNPITYREGKGVIYIEPGPLAGELVVAPKGTPAAGTTVRRTTLNVMKQPLRQVAKLLQEGTGTVIQVAPNVPDVPITIRISDASVNAGLSAILESARGSLPGLTLRTRDTGVYVLELGN